MEDGGERKDLCVVVGEESLRSCSQILRFTRTPSERASYVQLRLDVPFSEVMSRLVFALHMLFIVVVEC